MEKPRMAGPVSRFPGLLILLVLALPLGLGALEVETEVFPTSPRPLEIFSVTVAVFHPRPAEVQVLPPDLPRGLVLKGVKTEGALRTSASGSDQRWTEVVFSFMSDSQGSLSLGPFTVKTPSGEVRTEPVSITVASTTPQKAAPPYLVWDGVPGELYAGKAVEFRLLLVNGGSDPGGACFLEASEGILLESLSAGSDDQRAGAVARFRLTPLVPGKIVLAPARYVRSSGEELRSSSLSITVSAASPGDGGEQKAVVSRPPRSGAASLPAARVGLPPRLQALAGTGLSSPETLWRGGDYAQALARLRAEEARSPLGPVIRRVREEAERELSLYRSPGELWAPPLLLLPLSLLLMLAALAAFLRSRKRPDGSDVHSLRSSVLPLSLALLALLWLSAVRLDERGLFRGSRAVLHAVSARLVPDEKGEESSQFLEGEAVRLFPGDGQWSYVEAADGRSGWIAADRAIPY